MITALHALIYSDDAPATHAFSSEVEDMGFGLGISLKLPGADDILLYQPKHPTALHLEVDAT